MEAVDILRGQLREYEVEMNANKANTTSTLEEAIRLASSQLTHSILPISCPKNKDYDDIIQLLTKNQNLNQSNNNYQDEYESQK